MSAAGLNNKPFLRLHFRLKHSNPRDSIQSAALSKVIPKLRLNCASDFLSLIRLGWKGCRLGTFSKFYNEETPLFIM